jgi:hypothetical protein
MPAAQQEGVEGGELPPPDYGKLYHVVGSMFQPGGGGLKDAATQQRMIRQLEPDQRCGCACCSLPLAGNCC